MRTALAVCLAALLSATVCSAAGIRDLADGWLLGPGAVARLTGSGGPAVSGLWCTAGHSRLYGLAELPVRGVSAGWRLSGWPGQPTCQLGWQALGDTAYREESRQIHVQAGRALAFGLAVEQVRVATDFGGPDLLPPLAVWQVAATVQWDSQPEPETELRLRFWLVLQGIDESVLARGRQPLLRFEGWRGPTALAVALDLKPDLTPAVGLEAVLSREGAACGLRLEPGNGVGGPVLYWRRGALQLATSHLTHPRLGTTHRFRLGFGNWGASRW